MSELFYSLYYSAPSWLRDIMATVEGYRLRLERYGSGSEDCVREILDRDRWGETQWRQWQGERLSLVLRRAAAHVPFYRRMWEERLRQGDHRPLDTLENWPYLEKEDLRRSAPAFVADDCSRRRMRTTLTSGTTGQPIQFWYGRQSDHDWWALCEARWRRWNRVSRFDRWALLAGRLIVPLDQRDPPFWVWNGGLNQLYLSAYHLSPEALPLYLEALDKYEVRYIWGHSSALHTLALEALRLRKRVPLELALTTAEPLYRVQKLAIEEAFECPVRETYGMAEMAAAASECECGGMHFWPELGQLELLPVDSSPQSCELVVTTFLNPDMPLIRYRTGDLVDIDATRSTCRCGRGLPLIGRIEGRTSDILYTIDRRPVSPSAAEIVFDANIGVQEAQLIQEDYHRVVVRYVAPRESQAQVESVLRQRIVARFGSVQVEFEPVRQIARGPNGKFRAAVCRIPMQHTIRAASSSA